jgi:hypothetical protein
MRNVLKLLGTAITVAALALVVVSNALADPRISATATANADRSISVSWSPTAGDSGGALIINTSPQTDATGELPDNNSTIDFDLLNAGTTSYKTSPLQGLAITQPTTVYAQVQLIDPFGDGSCTQGDFGADCDSPVIPVIIQPHPQISATATVNADRSVSVSWNVPAGESQGAFIINTTSLTDATGELPFDAAGDPTVEFDLLNAGWTSYKTLPLDMTITQPTTVYAQVQLDDPFGDGSCSQGSFFADCDSQVIALTIQPLCTQTVKTTGHYAKKLVKRAHWLLHHRKRVKWSQRYQRPQYVKRHGYVWVKATYKRVWVPPVYSTECH